jgi:hypothetical protein
MEVFKKPEGCRDFILPGFCTTWMLERLIQMRHKDLDFGFGRKITRVLLWESQGAHFGTESNDNVKFYEVYSSRLLTIQDTVLFFPLYFLVIPFSVNSNQVIGTVVSANEQGEPSKTPQMSTIGRTEEKISK